MNDNRYTAMQRRCYDRDASQWTINERDHVVGTFDAHNTWADYEHIFTGIDPARFKELDVLDFATGPGRNLVRYASRFRSIDGVDISELNLANARLWIEHNGLDANKFKLFCCNGVDLCNINTASYDLVMSTIAFQHICVYSIRFNYLEEFFRVLRAGGYLCMQMGYGVPSPKTVGYYEDFFDASHTNRGCDVAISTPREIEQDLLRVGFTHFRYVIGPTGPGDIHPHWIYFSAKKP
jgi:ubiquinone/menaquinone biosynthesis C-methylase UbiE